ncbi:MAG: tetratricopeptide repeat protein [Pseudomonadota bacterium]|nr:tetratricopeptide repeat protein [Pseudomonadota bacterium]
MIIYAAIIAIQVALIIDVIRHGANRVWIMALMFLPMASTIAYVIVEVVPRMKHNRHVRQAQAQIIEKLDPERELRFARDALDLAQTAANRMRYADALVARGRHAEALPFYRDAIGTGPADYRTGEKLARCQYLSDRSEEALATLDAMKAPSAPSDKDRIALLRARIFEDLGRDDEAGAIYADLVDRFPGDEVRCRYAGLLLKQGRKTEARRLLDEVEHRLKRMDRQRRAENGPMYDWAMSKLKELRA